VPVRLERVLVRDRDKPRSVTLDQSLITTDPDEALGAQCDIVVEVMGGEQPAYDYMRQALEKGHFLVTANKEVMAKHGPALLSVAAENGVDVLYEASVGGGIPIISPLKRDLSANDIMSLRAIINGTTNYILTRMTREGMDFSEALKQAQALGYAEPDPTNDIEGHDAAYKIAILASLAFHTRVAPDDVYREGISGLTARDLNYAAELGYAVKLLAIARREDHKSVQVRVHPTLIKGDELLAKVDGVLNAVQVEGDLVGRVLFQGAGAGSLPTTSAVMADVLDAARSIVLGSRPFPWRYTSDMAVQAVSELVSRYYIRLEVADRPGVLAGIAGVFGENQVSISSVNQPQTDEEAQTAEIVIMTHAAQEAWIRKSMEMIGRLPDVRRVGNVVRVEG
jgi:homoserine dehydrogenase